MVKIVIDLVETPVLSKCMQSKLLTLVYFWRGIVLCICTVMVTVSSFVVLEQAFFPLGPLSQMIYGGLSAIIFSAYIVYDTDNLIKRYTYDEFIWASVALYLDVINLFLAMLEVLRSMSSNN